MHGVARTIIVAVEADNAERIIRRGNSGTNVWQIWVNVLGDPSASRVAASSIAVCFNLRGYGRLLYYRRRSTFVFTYNQFGSSGEERQGGCRMWIRKQGSRKTMTWPRVTATTSR
jgi:hypothetical protein